MTRTDERLEKVEQITIDFQEFKKALKRNYLSNDYYSQRHNRSFVLRLYPSFEAEMRAEYYESQHGTRYDNNWSEKPYHIKPEIILLEGCDKNPFKSVQWPTKSNLKNNILDEDLEDLDLDEELERSREFFWNEIKSFLPEKFNLAKCNHSLSGYAVKINWTNLE